MLSKICACVPDASLAAVTAFHVVEHLDPMRLGELVAEIHRVLVPGGIVVLETPNPENVTVGLVNFYIDADHVRPVPPPLMVFHAREAGFPVPWIARVNRALMGAPLAEVPSTVPGALEINAVVYAVNGLLFTAPDYALVAQKAGGARPPFDVASFEQILGPQPRELQAHRAVAAEETARRLAAEKQEAEARAAELELVCVESTRRADEATERLGVNEARALEADQRARSAEQEARQAWEDVATVSDSLSWRVTAPLRAAGAVARRFSSKRYAKLAVGHPMRWALTQPRLGPFLDKGLARVPAVEHKVRVAIYETRVAPSGVASHAPTSHEESDLSGLSESARAVVADLERAMSDEGR